MKYFSHRQKLHRLKEGLKAIACFKVFQVIQKLMLLSLRLHTCLLSLVLILLLRLLNDVLRYVKHFLKGFFQSVHKSLIRFAVFCGYGCLIYNGFSEAMAIYGAVGWFAAVAQLW